jgi:hypothetical protein
MALHDDIFAQVQTNAQVAITNFVSGLGVRQVNVLTTPRDPDSPLPDSCK